MVVETKDNDDDNDAKRRFATVDNTRSNYARPSDIKRNKHGDAV